MINLAHQALHVRSLWEVDPCSIAVSKPELSASYDLRVERLFYDGLRSVQEVNVDPLVSMSVAASGEWWGRLANASRGEPSSYELR